MTVRWKRKKNKRLPSPTAPPAEKPTTVLAQLSRRKQSHHCWDCCWSICSTPLASPNRCTLRLTPNPYIRGGHQRGWHGMAYICQESGTRRESAGGLPLLPPSRWRHHGALCSSFPVLSWSQYCRRISRGSQHSRSNSKPSARLEAMMILRLSTPRILQWSPGPAT